MIREAFVSTFFGLACLAALVLLWRAKLDSDARHRAVFDDAPVAYHEIDCDGIIRRVNRAECELLGYAPGELIGRPIAGLVASEQQHLVADAIRRKFAGKKPLRPFQREYIRGDGSRIAVRIHETPVRDRSGGIVRLRSALLDITESRRTEAALRESETRYRRLFDNIPIGIYRTTPEGRVLMANPALLRMLGYSTFGEIAHINLEEGNGPAYDRAAFKERLEREGEIRGREAVLAGRNGARVTVVENARIVRHENGDVLYYEGTLEDITERKRAEEQLRISEERYRRLFEDANDIVYSHDLEGRITSVNKAGERILGYSRSEAVAMNISQIVSAGHLPLITETIAGALAGEPPRTRELQVCAKDGRLLSLEVSARLVFENGTPVGLYGIARDVTERKRWEAELRRKNTDLELALAAAREATEAKSRFLANVSHEIRTPLNGVVGMTELLLRTALTPEQREFAEAVGTSAEALLLLINDILDFSKAEAGKLELHPLRFSPARLVEQVRSILRVQAEKKGLQLRVVCNEGIPAVINADEARVRQVLINLAGNGIKFTESGWVEMRAGICEPGGMLRFEIMDTGVGIDPAHSPRLFQSFVQVDSSLTRKHGGTGLGLAISKQLVSLMGGEIGFDSRPGGGSTFWFTLPLHEAAEADDNVTPPPGALARTAGERHVSGRILLAEDNELNRRIALRMLTALGCHVDAVANGRLAVEAAAAGKYDLILMDIHMPEMDGFTATGEIRRGEPQGRRTPIIAMTARAMAGDREDCLAAGMDDYVSKPIRFDELRAALERWITAPAEALAVPC